MITQKFVEGIPTVGSKRLSQMTFRLFPNLKYHLKHWSLSKMFSHQHVANMPLTYGYFFLERKTSKHVTMWFHSDFTLNIWVYRDISVSLDTWITAPGQLWPSGGNQEQEIKLVFTKGEKFTIPLDWVISSFDEILFSCNKE